MLAKSAALAGGDDPMAVTILVDALSTGSTGVCLCDETDRIRFVNDAFRRRFCPTLAAIPSDFVDALCDAIRQKRGIRLESVPIDTFATHIRARRQQANYRFAFPVDLWDGSWWWVTDHKLANGWLLAVTNEVSPLKDEEFKLRHAHASALRAAQTDVLTGLANRRHGFDQADAAYADFTANRLPLAIALIDLDHFKLINDTFGHDAGDRVLVHFAQTMTASIGPRDCISRVGGEEFLLLMPGSSAVRAERRLRRWLDAMSSAPGAFGEPGPALTVSAGIAAARPGEDVKAMLRRADAALYEAKAQGRNRIVTVGA